MYKRIAVFLSMAFAGSPMAHAGTAATVVSPTGSILKMVLGLAAVLAIMAIVSWAVKRMMPGATGQSSAVRIVGGVSVGSRERVVVLEVADRWIVVGVAPGQVNGIANLERDVDRLSESLNQAKSNDTNPISVQPSVHSIVQPLVNPFSEWLKKSADKAKGIASEKFNAKE